MDCTEILKVPTEEEEGKVRTQQCKENKETELVLLHSREQTNIQQENSLISSHAARKDGFKLL